MDSDPVGSGMIVTVGPDHSGSASGLNQSASATGNTQFCFRLFNLYSLLLCTQSLSNVALITSFSTSVNLEGRTGSGSASLVEIDYGEQHKKTELKANG